MRVVIQRVKSASVSVHDEVVGNIDQGLLVLIGVGHDDTEAEAKWLADKTAVLRIFADDQGKMNLNVEEIKGAVLVVSQFTLLGDCRKGRRPAFTDAAEPGRANELYLHYAECLRDRGIPVQQGIFAADMQVSLVNDGPVTLILDR
ncbi:D-tyrosyl-tRNA(Tyr) deacylase [Rubripirellula obstinata]|uniref:D-aminoacyl-tRNA deacylase n=1 Tax=Rubripirellula obstinata TaxID=406547 RepID=A0A5B1CL36_9BACT|nr:D-aminoacyl-tRNA deacylase [Rubripirellula obstinata]KAA1260469.1 D-tyrosyl-tRNA(Tyr) deacylase [Rubripirellula obstinata]